MNHGNEYVNVYSFRKLCKTKFSVLIFAEQWAFTSCCILRLTPNAEKRFRLGCGSLCLLRKTSDLGRGGFFGRIITRDSSRMSSSKSLLSDETDNCLCTWPWCSVEFQSAMQEQRETLETMEWSVLLPRRAHFAAVLIKNVLRCAVRQGSHVQHMFMIPNRVGSQFCIFIRLSVEIMIHKI